MSSYEDVNVADECLVFGFPIGLPRLSISKGIISAKGPNLIRELPFDVLQLDARVNKGNSGGPAFLESNGKAIGIVTMKYIPFMTEIDQLERFAESIPVAPTGGVGLGQVDFGGFFNYMNQSVREIAKSLQLVQVGIGWAIPLKYFEELVRD